jgi:YD repeat-containing protein
LEVTDNPGVTANLTLSGGPGMQSDYVISAWVYAFTGNHPVITVQRFQNTAAGANALNTFTLSDPAGQTFASKKWQRYELRLTPSQLRGSENLFATLNSGDYLQVKIGTGSAVGDGRKVDIDDIVCRPASAAFALSAYDLQGRLIHSTDTYHVVHTHEYDTFGNLSVSRDDRFRYYRSAATHAIGEND